MPLSAADAETRLRVMVAAAQEPKLTDDQIAILITIAKRVDAAGLSPDDPAWTPTWDLRAAAAEGWRWKAAKAVGLAHSAPAGGEPRLDFTQLECTRMAQMYSRRGAMNIRTPTDLSDPPQVT